MTHREVVERLGYKELALHCNLNDKATSMWKSRNIIPAEHWGSVVRFARIKREPITIQKLYYSIYPD